MFKICQVKTRDDIDRLFCEERVAENRNPEDRPPRSTHQSENTGNFRDVHIYDGKLAEIKIEKYSSDQQQGHISHLQTLCRHPFAVRMLDIILHRDNYDPANRVDSADLLTWICTHNITPELFYLLEEQLADNFSLGTCLQGSSHRIRQIYDIQIELDNTEVNEA